MVKCSLICDIFATIEVVKEGGIQMETISVGDIVETGYNSGIYLGEVIEDRGNSFLVKILAVLTHPLQGDLHNRGQVVGVAFHERKALGFHEKTNTRKRQTSLYTGDVPQYETSLQQAINTFKKALLKEDTDYNRLSLSRLGDLETYFYDKILKSSQGDE